MGSERERARESFNRKNEKEKWVGFRERELYQIKMRKKMGSKKERERELHRVNEIMRA